MVARAVFALALGAVSIAVTMALTWNLASQSGQAATAPDRGPVLLKPLATRSIIYDRNGAEMALLFAEQDRQEVPLSA
ncbi:MAG TPA: hypothetical protein PLV93_06905, partial [Microthrixaceae bacterium]|nr:hypothetical protein [Microthrixaceae bacterium]